MNVASGSVAVYEDLNRLASTPLLLPVSAWFPVFTLHMVGKKTEEMERWDRSGRKTAFRDIGFPMGRVYLLNSVAHSFRNMMITAPIQSDRKKGRLKSRILHRIV